MTNHLAPSRKLAISAIVAAVGLLSTAGNANAVSLYWTRPPVKSASVKTYLSFASSAMSGVGMQNIRVSSMEVAGTRGGVYAAITCFNTAPQATAIAMAAGDNGNDTKRLSEERRERSRALSNLIDKESKGPGSSYCPPPDSIFTREWRYCTTNFCGSDYNLGFSKDTATS